MNDELAVLHFNGGVILQSELRLPADCCQRAVSRVGFNICEVLCVNRLRSARRGDLDVVQSNGQACINEQTAVVRQQCGVIVGRCSGGINHSKGGCGNVSFRPRHVLGVCLAIGKHLLVRSIENSLYRHVNVLELQLGFRAFGNQRRRPRHSNVRMALPTVSVLSARQSHCVCTDLGDPSLTALSHASVYFVVTQGGVPAHCCIVTADVVEDFHVIFDSVAVQQSFLVLNNDEGFLIGRRDDQSAIYDLEGGSLVEANLRLPTKCGQKSRSFVGGNIFKVVLIVNTFIRSRCGRNEHQKSSQKHCECQHD